MKIAELIRRRIAEIPLGEPFTPATFVELGARATVDQTLSRLVKAGAITRLTRGIYLRPQQNQYVGAVMPQPAKVAEALARASGEKIQMHGAEAVRQFGFSTQMPTQPVFMTTGPSKTFHIGRLPVTLKHASPRKLALANREAGVALSALWYLGKNHVTPEVVARIHSQLPEEEFEALKAAKSSMPAWMSNALHLYEKQTASA
jgi:hypothetical protein